MAVVYDVAAEVDERNGWKDDTPTPDELAAEIEFGAKGMREFLLFIWDGVVLGDDEAGLQLAFSRFCSVAYFLCPEILRVPSPEDVKSGRKWIKKLGPPITLEELAAMPQVRSTRNQLQKLALKFAEQWGYEPLIQKCLPKKEKTAN